MYYEIVVISVLMFGVIIASTVIAALTGQNPTKKEILAVCLSFIGVLALVLIPI
ncbi:MAG: hypothetical protein J6A83_02705 [Clostridia bacterium]|nr:hypothetical protein [Clostridia bacterium]